METTQTDCLIVGAGPAGLSAALWLERLGVRFLVLERATDFGGEVSRINLPIRDYLGLSATDGRAFVREVARQIAPVRASLRFGIAVARIDPAALRVETSQGTFHARSLILATGVRRRRLEVPGAEALIDRGLSYSGTRDRDRIAGQAVAVLGGGDGALENALLLAAVCPRVVVLHRGQALDGRRSFVERVGAHPRVEVWLDAQVVGLDGGAAGLEAIRLATPGGPQQLAVPWLVVKIGFVPNTEAIEPGALAIDAQGYIDVDRSLRTSATGVFAVGDVANPRAPCIAAAAGDGAVAARGVHDYLEGSAG